MAPTKRRRRVMDVDDSDDEMAEVRSTYSSVRHDDSRKRLRVSVAGPSRATSSRRDETSSSESGEEEAQDVSIQSPPRTQYELSRDADFVHLQDEDQDTHRATQMMQTRPALIGDNHAAESGIIESITCMNFMCHEHLTCELGPLINFIVGENGSGKSAVLTAITLCLGGKASATNRGGSLKDLIKQNRDHAGLVIKIKNQGSDAYQPEIYGDSIIVERHFSRNGSSGFKIKSSQGRIISTKKQDVDDIVEYWSLQVDNPLNILSQDNARQFLNSSSPASKYKFFVQGVQLEQLDNDYRLLQEIYEQTEEKFRIHQETAQKKKRELEEATALARTVEKNQEMRARARLYTNQLAWAQVVEQEQILQQRTDAIGEADRQITQAEQEMQEKSRVLEELDERLQRAKDAHDELLTDREEYAERIEAADTDYQKAKKTLESVHVEERDLHTRLKNARDDVIQNKERIREEEQRLADANGDIPLQKQQELDSAKRREAKVEDALRKARAAGPALERRKEEVGSELKKVESVIAGKRDEIAAAEERLQTLSQGSGTEFAAYEPNMQRLLGLIERDGGFDVKPVGPIGNHIRLLQPIWSSVLERFFGGSLNGFIVFGKRDQERLSAMMQRAGIRQSPIFIGGQHRLNTDGKEPAREFDTILRALKIDDDMVRSQLIINHSIEQHILVEDRSKAQRIMWDGPGPEKVVAALCLHDGKRGFGIRVASRNGINSTTILRPYNGRPRMKSDKESQVSLQKENLTHLRREHNELEADGRRLQQALRRCESELSANKSEVRKLEQDLRRSQADVERVSEELDAFEGVGSRLEALREELQGFESTEDHLGTQYGNMQIQKLELNKQAEESKKKLTGEKERQRNFNNQLAKAEAKVKKCTDLRQIAVAEKNQACEAVELAQMEKGRVEAERDEQARNVEEFTAQAAQCVPERVRIPEGETYKTIEKKYESIKKQLEARRRQVGFDDQEIFDRKAAAQRSYQQTVKQLKAIQQDQDALKDTIWMRQERWRNFQRFISARARACFLYLLSERGFRGRLQIDHPNKTLALQVEPDETRKSAAGRSTKTLSGGEKSFSSICLLLSIWEAMGSPLRCLDEFDVFMDNVNRAISTNMLIMAARRSVSRQFILITPNAIEGRASLDDDVKIIRLTDPRQRTLI